MVNTIKTALEQEAVLLQFEDDDTVRAGLTHKVEKLCRVLHVSEQGKTQLLEHIETLLDQRIKKNKNALDTF